MSTATQPSMPSVRDMGRWYEEQERTQPMRFQVSVRSWYKGEWELQVGSIVTYLSLEDYCDLHGLQLVEWYRGTRHALPHERTELI
jgi:hypothetical protein